MDFLEITQNRNKVLWGLIEYLNTKELENYTNDNRYWDCKELGILHLYWHKSGQWCWHWLELKELPKELQLGEEKNNG